MIDPSRRNGLKRFLYGKGAILAVLAIGAPAIAAVLITSHKTPAEEAIDQWGNEQSYGARAVSALHAAATQVGLPVGKGAVVSSEQELRRAVENAADGDVIRVAPGVYPQVGLGNIVKQGEVVITSADPDRPAVFTRLIIRQSAGITLRGIELAADASAAPPLAAGEAEEEGSNGTAEKPMSKAELRAQWMKNREARQAAGKRFEQAGAGAPQTEGNAAPEGEQRGREGNGEGGGEGRGKGQGEGRISFPFIVLGSERITLDRLNIHGPLDNKAAAYRITALMVRNSKQVTISNSRFHNLRNGMGMLALDGIRVQNNEFTDIRSDGVHGGDISNAEISGNLFTDFHPAAADHPDAMQLWSTPRATTLENIAIHDNLVVRGGGQPMQGVFLRDVKNNMAFRNVEIRDNLVLGGLYNGIAVCCVTGGAIEGNQVVNYPDRPQSWIRINGSNGLTLRNNSASKFLVVGSEVNQSGNRAEQHGRINEAALIEAWLKAKPSRRRPDSALQARLLGNSGS